MEITEFQKSFKNNEIKLKTYILVVSILLSILLIIIFFNNNLEDYYISKATVKDKKINIVVGIDDLEKITNNKKIKIKNNIFTYKIEKMEDLLYINDAYKSIYLEVDNLTDEILIENNNFEVKIVINKETIFSYLLKTLKGE